ncbi:DUF2946 family protein [Roseibium sediminis]|uniref:DUF2946 family protein n=1 Tax=Roseibium sediminis TaxID=1775174 RepID=UPI00123DCEB0|nr:DUF2946 family protein [Roseibium sediminis]
MTGAGKKWRSIAGALLLLPMLLSAVIPQGFMPTTTEDGYISVTLCTTEGLRTVLLNEEGAEVSPAKGQDLPENQRRAGEHCLFAATVALSLPEQVRFQAPLELVSVSLEQLTDFDLSPQGPILPIGARAPPASA